MAKLDDLGHTDTTLGGAAVDGLLAGVGAGLAMALFLALAALTLGQRPDTLLGRFDPSGAGSPATGTLAHLAVAGVYGALFGGAWRLIPIRRGGLAMGLLCGSAYGLALWAVAAGALSSTGQPPLLFSALKEVPAAHLVLAHLVYGLALGVIFHRGKTLAMPRKS
jgi:hypothetical protein